MNSLLRRVLYVPKGRLEDLEGGEEIQSYIVGGNVKGYWAVEILKAMTNLPLLVLIYCSIYCKLFALVAF